MKDCDALVRADHAGGPGVAVLDCRTREDHCAQDVLEEAGGVDICFLYKWCEKRRMNKPQIQEQLTTK